MYYNIVLQPTKISSIWLGFESTTNNVIIIFPATFTGCFTPIKNVNSNQLSIWFWLTLEKLFFWFTGWRVGWAISLVEIASAIRNIHVKLTDLAAAPFQEAALIALQSVPEYFESLRMVSQKELLFLIFPILMFYVAFRISFLPFPWYFATL